ERAPHHLDKTRRLDWLGNEIVGLPPERAQYGLGRIHPSHDDDLRRRLFGNTARQEIQPSNSWQLNVEQHHTEVVSVDLLQGPRSVSRRVNLKARVGQERSQALSCRVIVINNKHVRMSHDPTSLSFA